MKITVELPDDVVKAARAYATRERVTLRFLIERGLRLAMSADREQRRFRLRDRSVVGRGLQAAYRGADWSYVRESIDRGRGN